ncbi:MAG: type II toxin-antitoxin system VapB family antitoxin [Janthinobacterium lividum]
MMLSLMRRWLMRTTITLDDEQVATAMAKSGIKEKSALVRAALDALIQREAARRLMALSGSMPGFKPGPRKRYFEPE